MKSQYAHAVMSGLKTRVEDGELHVTLMKQSIVKINFITSANLSVGLPEPLDQKISSGLKVFHFPAVG